MLLCYSSAHQKKIIGPYRYPNTEQHKSERPSHWDLFTSIRLWPPAVDNEVGGLDYALDGVISAKSLHRGPKIFNGGQFSSVIGLKVAAVRDKSDKGRGTTHDPRGPVHGICNCGFGF